MRFQFSIASLLAITTLVAVVCGAFMAAPGLGIALTIASVPALARTILMSLEKQSQDEPMPMPSKIGYFALWLGVGALALGGGALVAGAVAFIVFMSNCLGGASFTVTFWDSTAPRIAGLVVAIVLMAIFWRKIEF